MPLDGNDNASQPPDTAAVTLTPVSSSDWNAVNADIYSILNTVRTIGKGFTGAATAAGAIKNFFTGLSAETELAEDDILAFSDTSATSGLGKKITWANFKAKVLRNLQEISFFWDNNTSATGPLIILERATTAPSTGVPLAGISFRTKNSAGETIEYASIGMSPYDPTDGSEDGSIVLGGMIAGSPQVFAEFREQSASFPRDVDIGDALSVQGTLFVDDASTFDSAATFQAGINVNGTGNFNNNITVDGNASVVGDVSANDATFTGTLNVSSTAQILGSLETLGAFTAAGTITGQQNYVTTNAAMIFAPGSAGAITWRPNGIGSSTGQMQLGTTGNLVLNGNVSFVGDLLQVLNNSSTTVSGGSSATAGANLELYGGTHASLANRGYMDASRFDFRSQNGATTYGYFDSTGLNVTLAIEAGTTVASGSRVFASLTAGTLVLRPNGPASTTGQVAIGTTGNVTIPGNLTITGALSKGSGTFRIADVLDPDNYELVHGFIEGPRYDLIYRGEVKLSGGLAEVDIDALCNPANPMEPGTFAALTINAQVTSLQNQEGYARVKPGPVVDGKFTIFCEDPSCSDKIAWVVIAERNDPFIRSSIDPNTDENGRFVTRHKREQVEDEWADGQG